MHELLLNIFLEYSAYIDGVNNFVSTYSCDLWEILHFILILCFKVLINYTGFTEE